MKTATSTLKGLALVIFVLALNSIAHAQATRTWVSGTGDDLNPCSRTAPCKTFAGAISKTAINGEIDALDPAGYGTINITKSITIDGTGTLASILASGVNGVTINLTDASGNDPQHSVTLRNLSINGTGLSGTIGTRTGVNGVNIVLAAGVVNIDKCMITDFTNKGINDIRTTGGKLVVTDTLVKNTNSSGVSVAPSSGATPINVAADNVTVSNCGFGFAIGSGVKATVSRSTFTGNGNGGIYADGLNGASELTVDGSSSANNGIGVQNGGGTTTIRLSNCNVMNNTTSVSGSAFSYGTNRVAGGPGALSPIGGATSAVGQQ